MTEDMIWSELQKERSKTGSQIKWKSCLQQLKESRLGISFLNAKKLELTMFINNVNKYIDPDVEDTSGN